MLDMNEKLGVCMKIDVESKNPETSVLVCHSLVSNCTDASYSYRMMTLSIVQKCDIVTRELDELKDEMQHVKDESERSCDNFRASCESVILHKACGD